MTWKRALLWVVPFVVWVMWIAYVAQDIQTERKAIRSESFEAGQNLAACLDFALDNFTTPSASKRDACEKKFPGDEARVARQKEKHERRIHLDLVSHAAALAALIAYFVFVPRRFRAGFRVWILVGAALLVLGGIALFIIASGMPHGD